MRKIDRALAFQASAFCQCDGTALTAMLLSVQPGRKNLQRIYEDAAHSLAFLSPPLRVQTPLCLRLRSRETKNRRWPACRTRDAFCLQCFCRPFFTANKPDPPFFAGRDLEPRSLMDLGILDRTELFLWDGLQVCHSDAHPGGADILTRDSQRNDLTGKCGLLGRCVMRTTVIHSPPIPQD